MIWPCWRDEKCIQNSNERHQKRYIRTTEYHTRQRHPLSCTHKNTLDLQRSLNLVTQTEAEKRNRIQFTIREFVPLCRMNLSFMPLNTETPLQSSRMRKMRIYLKRFNVLSHNCTELHTEMHETKNLSRIPVGCICFLLFGSIFFYKQFHFEKSLLIDRSLIRMRKNFQ